MQDVFHYFGYGSLVNADTRPPESRAVPGRLNGWIREWRLAGTMPGGGACGLTIRPHAGASIAGVLVADHVSRLPELDAREHRYDRLAVGQGMFTPDETGLAHREAFVYRAKSEHRRWGDTATPVLLSYVDCVLAGFHSHWGEAGVRDFIATTEGWHVPILNDRKQPRYVRAVNISDNLRVLIDAALAEAGARIID